MTVCGVASLPWTHHMQRLVTTAVMQQATVDIAGKQRAEEIAACSRKGCGERWKKLWNPGGAADTAVKRRWRKLCGLCGPPSMGEDAVR